MRRLGCCTKYSETRTLSSSSQQKTSVVCKERLSLGVELTSFGELVSLTYLSTLTVAESICSQSTAVRFVTTKLSTLTVAENICSQSIAVRMSLQDCRHQRCKTVDINGGRELLLSVYKVTLSQQDCRHQ